MSIKLIYDYFSPAYKAGGPTQSLANMVAELDMPLDVLATNEDLDRTVLDVDADCWIPLDKHSKKKVWYCSAGRRTLSQIIGSEDVLFINSIFSHHFDYTAIIRSKAGRKIVSPRGMLDPGSLSQKRLKKRIYLALWKIRGLDKRVEWHATTELEKENIQRVFGRRAKVWVVPNLPKTLPFLPKTKETGRLKMASIAVISPMKNHKLVLEALSKSKEWVEWDIYGPVKDGEYWTQCLEMIHKLPPSITVNYHGDIPPAAVTDALEKVHIAMLPSKSENFGHSIYEALTAGKPVVTSHNTPWNGMEAASAGINVGVDSTNDLQKAISFFSGMGPEVYERWSKAARNFALEATDLPAIKAGYEEMFGI